MDWNTELAQGLRNTGIAWDKIGRVFGVTGDTVKIRLDPAYAEKRRDANNTRRQVERDAARVVIEAPQMVPVASDPAGTFMTASGFRAYQVQGMDQVITLPFLSIQRGEG